MDTDTTHEITDIFSFEATEPGALPGHLAVCSCGGRFTTSLSENEAARLGEAHVRYYMGVKKTNKAKKGKTAKRSR